MKRQLLLIFCFVVSMPVLGAENTQQRLVTVSDKEAKVVKARLELLIGSVAVAQVLRKAIEASQLSYDMYRVVGHRNAPNYFQLAGAALQGLLAAGVAVYGIKWGLQDLQDAQ